MVTVLRPLSTSELLDRTFHLYRNNFLVFVGIMAIPQLFVLLLQLGAAAMLQQHMQIAMTVTTVVALFAIYAAIYISQAATIMAVSDLHLEKPASIGSAYSSARPTLGRVFWIVFLSFVILSLIVGVTGGMISVAAVIAGPFAALVAGFLLLIPALFIAVRWFLAWSLSIPVTVLEGGGFKKSIDRSSTLTKGSRGRIFGVYFLVGIFAAIFGLLLQFLFLAPLTLLGINDLAVRQAVTQGLQSFGGFVSTSLVGPLATIALTLIYYDQRVRKEGFDLQLMMATMQQGQPAVAAGVVAPNP